MSTTAPDPDPSDTSTSASATASTRPAPRPQSSRHSILPAQPPPPLSLHAKCYPAEHAIITGSQPITLSENCVIHPYAKLDSRRGPIVLAESVVLWERAMVGVGSDKSSTSAAAGDAEEDTIDLGCFVVVGAGAVVEGSLGRGTEVGVGARVGQGARIGEYCRIAPGVQVPPGTRIPDYTVLYPLPSAGGYQTRVNIAARDNARVRSLLEKGQAMHIDMMRRLLKVNIAKWQVAS